MVGLNAWSVANLGLLVVVLVLMAVASMALAIFLAIRVRKVQQHYDVLTQGTDGGNLQEVLEAHLAAVRSTGIRISELETVVVRLEREGTNHLQKFGVVRFNPFRDAGGDQSFALALANADGNGVVISSLHGREGSRVYGKPLEHWMSAYPLSEEERKAIDKAKTASLGEAQRREQGV